MKLSKIFIVLMFLVLAKNIYALEITEDEQYKYIKKSWPEIADQYQRDLMCYFNEKLSAELLNLNVPTFWNEEAKKVLLANLERFRKIVADVDTQAAKYATDNNFIAQELIPTGFILGLGISGSGNIGVGIGGSAMITLIVVPYQVERIDKATQETATYYDAYWAIGGMGQQGVGVGVQAGLVVRGAVGMIWGPLPDAESLTGTATGVTGNISAVNGLGFKGAILFNSTTNLRNLIAMATYDMGPEIGSAVAASVFYFMNAEEIANFIACNAFRSATGVDTIYLQTP